MSRITRTGRDWIAPTHISPWQQERSYRYVPLATPRAEHRTWAFRIAATVFWMALIGALLS